LFYPSTVNSSRSILQLAVAVEKKKEAEIYGPRAFQVRHGLPSLPKPFPFDSESLILGE
jgi:hypothetical protein